MTSDIIYSMKIEYGMKESHKIHLSFLYDIISIKSILDHDKYINVRFFHSSFIMI